MSHFLMAALITLAACQQGWGLTCTADVMDLCDYRDAECKTGEMDLCNYKKMSLECSAGEFDLCDYKKMPLECSAGEFDLCDYKTAIMPSPVATPTPSPATTTSCAANELDLCVYKDAECKTGEMDLCNYKKMPLECSAGEFDLCDYKTAIMPSPVATPTPSPATTAMATTSPPPVIVTAFDIEFEVTDVTKLDMDQLKAAMAAASQVNADNVEIGSVVYKTKVSYTMPESVSKAAATTAIAKSCNVAESQVEVVLATSRRLSETRRLATTIAAIIKTTTASEADSVVTKAKDEALLKQAFTDAGLTVGPTVTAQPTTSFAAKITLKGEAGATAPATPLADAIQTQVKAKMGIDIVASISNVVKVAEWALSASTTMEEEEPADAAKGQNSMLWMACAMAATLLLKAI